MSLDSQAKEKIYSRVCELVARKHFDPGMNGANWEELSKSRADQILRSGTDEEFEKQIQELLNEIREKQLADELKTPRQARAWMRKKLL